MRFGQLGWRWVVGGIAVVLLAMGGMGIRHAMAADDDEGSETGLHLRSIASKHYAIRTDLEDAFAKELATRMDTMYDEYQKHLSEFKQPDNAPPLPAYLFTKKEDYARFTHAPPSDGVFVTGPRPFLAAHQSSGRDRMRTTLQHEAFHQFAYFAISKNLPIWLNEGLAQEFEEGVWTGSNFWMKQVPPERLREIQSDIKAKRLIPFKKFTAITPQQWSSALGTSDHQDATNYNEAWALAHFLLESGSTKYHDQLIGMLRDLHGGMEAQAAFEKAFPNVQQVQNDFSNWFVALKPTAGSTIVDRQRTLGNFLIVLKNDQQKYRFNSMAEFRQMAISRHLVLVVGEGRFQWKTSQNPDEYFSDLGGREFGPGQLMFATATGDLPADILCAPSPADRLRTHFYRNEGKLECEVILTAAH